MDLFEFSHPSKEDWEKEAQKQLKGKSLADLNCQTAEDITLNPIYFAEDRIPIENKASAAAVLIAPCLFIESNKFNNTAKEVLKRGQSALTLNLDVTSQFADSGSHTSQLYGMIHLTEYEHFEKLFKDINLNSIPLFFDALLKFDTIFEHWKKYTQESGLLPAKVSGSLGADPLSAALIYGSFPQEEKTQFSKMAAVYADKKDFPQLDIITISADIIHNSGGHAVHELSYTLATVVYYIEQLRIFGIEPEQTLAALRVKLAVGNDQFKEIAKLRALRLLWENIQAAYDIKSPVDIKIDMVTSWRFLSARDIHSNMLRSTSQVFSALVAGCNSINILPYDLAITKTSESSRRLARNTALILLEESLLNKVHDPALGSAFIDNYSAELAQKAWHAFQEIEQTGGIVAVTKNGALQTAIENNADRQKEDLKTGKKKIIGLNFYKNDKEDSAPKNPHSLASHINSFKNIMPGMRIKPLNQARLDEDYEKQT